MRHKMADTDTRSEAGCLFVGAAVPFSMGIAWYYNSQALGWIIFGGLGLILALLQVLAQLYSYRTRLKLELLKAQYKYGDTVCK